MTDRTPEQIEAERWWSFRENSIEFSKEYGVATVKYLMLLNGGAIIALLTLFGNLKKDAAVNLDIPCLKISIAGYLFGLVCGCITCAMGYLNFQNNALAVPDPDFLQDRVSQKQMRRNRSSVKMTALVALVTATLGFVLFSLSSLVAVMSISAK
jgi:hypothetical protein